MPETRLLLQHCEDPALSTLAGYKSHGGYATLEKAYAERKPGQPPPKLSATLSSVAGEKAPIIIPEPAAVAGECTKCYVTLPVLEITGTDFITIVQGQNIKFHLPGNFIVNEAVLVDPKDATKVLKK
jgi:hypothetical protein